jgi:hypothetical protein
MKENIIGQDFAPKPKCLSNQLVITKRLVFNLGILSGELVVLSLILLGVI